MSWQDQCRAAGGVVTRIPNGSDAGALACRLPDPGNRAFPWRYQLAPLTARAADLWDQVVIGKARVDGAVVTMAQNKAQQVATSAVTNVLSPVARATGADRGALGVLGKVTGIPRWLILAGAAFAGYSILVGAKLAPPLRKVIK